MGQLMERETEEMLRKGRPSEPDDTNMTFDYMGCLEQSSATDSVGTPHRHFHTATPQPEHTDQNNMAER